MEVLVRCLPGLAVLQPMKEGWFVRKSSMLKYSLLLFVLSVGVAEAKLKAVFTADGESDVRVDRMAALEVPAGEAPTPFLKPGPFAVVWTAEIAVIERRRLFFSFEGKGSAVLLVNGKEVLTEEGELGAEKSKRVRLNPGRHPIEIRYQSEEDGSGKFRLYWEEKGIPKQTIPPMAFFYEPDEVAIAGELKRHGRMAFTEQNCAKCHVPEKGFGATPMPEVGEIAPILAGIGERVSEEWLRDWIANPKAMKHTTKMPQLVDPETEEGLQEAADLAAYLAASLMGGEDKESPSEDLAKAGGVHYHELGCAACHYPVGEGSAQADDGTGRVPLDQVDAKYKPGQLVDYLKKPDAYHPFSGMPDFMLSDEEAMSIAAYLRKEAKGKAPSPGYQYPDGDVARGAVVAEALQCGTCHPGSPGAIPRSVSLEGIFAVDWAEKGCVAENDTREELPDMNFHEGEVEGLLAFSKVGPESLKRKTSAEFASRQIDAKRCTSCHMMDDVPSLLDGVWDETAHLVEHVEDLTDRVDQTRPQLTFVGEMLYTTYIQKMLAGTIVESPRPWLGTRMPAFRAYAAPLADGLSRLHGFEPSGPIALETKAELVEIGHDLIGADGFGCTTCHGVGEMEPTAAFEVGAVNFALTPDRIREGYYYRWMDNPQETIPGTKMPKYADGNQSQRIDVLGGKADAQYEAIWHWLHSGKE